MLVNQVVLSVRANTAMKTTSQKLIIIIIIINEFHRDASLKKLQGR